MSLSRLLIVLFFSMFLLPFFIPWVNSSSDTLSSASLIQADVSLTLSYESVLAAEQSGAEVSTLLNQLNIAGGYLSEAYAWYHLGNSDKTNHFSDLCYNVATSVKTDAIQLKDASQTQRDIEHISIQFGSVTAVVVILVLSYVIWGVFKRRYYTQLLESKPEVDPDEA